jgi:hypothetical protein
MAFGMLMIAQVSMRFEPPAMMSQESHFSLFHLSLIAFPSHGVLTRFRRIESLFNFSLCTRERSILIARWDFRRWRRLCSSLTKTEDLVYLNKEKGEASLAGIPNVES